MIILAPLLEEIFCYRFIKYSWTFGWVARGSWWQGQTNQDNICEGWVVSAEQIWRVVQGRTVGVRELCAESLPLLCIHAYGIFSRVSITGDFILSLRCIEYWVLGVSGRRLSKEIHTSCVLFVVCEAKTLVIQLVEVGSHSKLSLSLRVLVSSMWKTNGYDKSRPSS